jgi:hypothetical protein|uniref:Uncharacterized protein n=1 Tax=viral metagenome TaxID=1070528 RepID=A0A6C0H970_9ZZZZ
MKITIIDKYKLKEYKYINFLEEFYLLPLCGSMKYINKFTNEFIKIIINGLL